MTCADSTDDDDNDDGGGGSRAASADVELDVSELSRSHNLPAHILHLRHVAESDITGQHQRLVYL